VSSVRPNWPRLRLGLFVFTPYGESMRKGAKRREPQIFLLCVTLSASAGVVSPQRVHHPRPRARKQKRATLASTRWKGCWAFLFHSESARNEAAKSRHTFITLACRLAVLRTEHRRRSEDLSPSLTVRQPSDCCPRKRHVWGTRQSRWFSWAGGFAVLTQPFRARGHIAQKPIRDHMRARLTSQGR